MFLTLKKMRQITISTYICSANKERRLVVKPVHLNFNYWKRTIENERPAVQRVSCFVYTICKWLFLRQSPEWGGEYRHQEFPLFFNDLIITPSDWGLTGPPAPIREIIITT